MKRALGSLVFYLRFLHDFSVLGLRRRARGWAPLQHDFSGQTWLVTGATGGIGRAIALAANREGARVVAVARDPTKLAALVADAAAPERVEVRCVDLGSVSATRALAASINGQIDVLVNNLGLLVDAWQATEEGVELSFACNLLNHFVLTEGLLASAALGPSACVINMASGGLYGAPFRLDALESVQPGSHDGMAAYAAHKRAQLVLADAWNHAWPHGPRAYAMHPGWVDTEGVRRSLPWFRRVLRRWLRTSEEGADTALWLATTRPDARAGALWFDREARPAHAFEFTRSGDDPARLRPWLAARVERALAARPAP